MVIFMSKKYTKESFNKKLKEIGRTDIELVGEYVNNKTPTEFHCNVCGNTWKEAPVQFVKKGSPGKCPVCHKKEIKEKFKLSQEEVVKRVKDKNENIEVVSEYENYYTPIKFKCKLDGYEWEQILSNFEDNPVCPMCDVDKTRHLISGVNDIATLRPDLLQYFIDPKDAKNLKLGSNKRMLFKCSNCGKEKELFVYDLAENGFRCAYCSDKISYPNKFLRAFLNELGIDYDLEWHDNWCKDYKYDAHFFKDGIEYLIEADGEYHNKENTLYYKTQFTNVKIRDRVKDKLAKENNCCLIRLDCYISDGDYISNSIFNSKLSEIFDLSDFNWVKCKIEAEKSLVKEVCDYYNSHINMSLKDIAIHFKLNRGTVKDYLNRGEKLHFTRSLFSNYGGIKITLYDKNSNIIATYGSCSILSKRSEEDLGKSYTRKKLMDIINNGGEIGDYVIKIAQTISDIGNIYYG